MVAGGFAVPTTLELKPTGYPHIFLDNRGRTWIDDSGIQLIQVVHEVLGDSRLPPDKIPEQYPKLNVAQAYAAMAYYHDNRAAVEAEIARDDAEYLLLRSKLEDKAWQAELYRRIEARRAK